MKTSYLAIALTVLVIAVVGIGLLYPRPESGHSSKLQVSASVYPLAYFAQQIGGDRAHVKSITPAGAEPHDYEPTPQDIAYIADGDLLILNGGGLESWGQKILQNIYPGQTQTVTVGDGLATQTILEDGENVVDPHVWLSPTLASHIVDRIEAGFAQADPENALFYAQNAQELRSKLGELHLAYTQGLANCASNDIVTSHAAFGYLAKAYHLNQIALSGISPDAEPSARQLATIAKFAKNNNIKVIFTETLLSAKLSQTIANEVGAQLMVLDPIEGLADDATGKNYFTQMQQNLSNLKQALQCK